MKQNQAKGIGTQLVPDCNVVIDIIRACSTDDTEQTRMAKKRLSPFISFLQTCQTQGISYYISPFMGLSEMRRPEAALGPSALEKFSKIYGLAWTDTHPQLQPDLNSIGLLERGYGSLSTESQGILSKTYSPLLLMLVIARDLTHLSPLAKFKNYLRLYRRFIDIVSVREITIARFLFAPTPALSDTIYQTWEKITLNFTGRKDLSQHLPRTARQLDRAALNGALDLVILDSALLSDYRGLDGQRLDTWIVTADLKLAALTDAVHHTDLGTGQTGKYLVTHDYRDQGEYWYQTHTVMEQLTSQYRPHLRPSIALQRARALRIMGLAEQGLNGEQKPPGIPLRSTGFQRIEHHCNCVLVSPPFS
ncbi:hypothetical protein [Pseudoxanthomonas winnipegensis]|uniref:Uncharacterized protein n=2 Tax=Pseudoxanthomonas winnipegensis TaxID=2480810 RepID=A0A4V2HEI2_9GAMM|nr:hypothetical protein [Pseudoxanthomonas winnipegensis]TAA32932.1 hypothetical protein EA661_01220 [Pseudoxanthomonas winnipegensis]TBV78585.1 hypothetical protein EYC46_01445 [Pseudoxanthomonas winnipegensis]